MVSETHVVSNKNRGGGLSGGGGTNGGVEGIMIYRSRKGLTFWCGLTKGKGWKKRPTGKRATSEKGKSRTGTVGNDSGWAFD